MDKSDSERGSRAQARLEEEGVMGWVKPAFDEIKDGRGGEVLQRRNHLVNAAPERAVNIRVRPPLTDRGHRAHAAPGRERGERPLTVKNDPTDLDGLRLDLPLSGER